MLVLARKCNEAIRIGETIEVRIVDIDRNKVRLGIEAPGEPVRRDEVPPSVSSLRMLFAHKSDDDRRSEMLEWVAVRLQLASEVMAFDAFQCLVNDLRDLVDGFDTMQRAKIEEIPATIAG